MPGVLEAHKIGGLYQYSLAYTISRIEAGGGKVVADSSVERERR